ncbi:hypothetical protein EG240_06620 [Paenimyroides tangerinum]|uniref:LVIVD repeat-containing protein n=1 Tax=Paenimyroides tangerinum TaxID=2488728 RepID=A0A3P3WF35_9FLAO|nr:hypothetical protein [Paenimyroides tangerinum]RRJ91173.1 hypothetical protein EG240_06620 [Paenimyroides tangerinum]
MKNKKFKLTFLGAALCFALVGCSNDDSVDGTNNNNSESGVVSNEDVTITYGSDLLKHYSESNNSKINLINGFSARSGNSLPTYQNQPITGAINLVTIANPSNVNTQSGSVYYIPTGETFNGNINLVAGVKLIIQGTYTGNLNFNGAAEIYVEGALNTSGTINVPSNGKIIVGPNATFGSNTTIHLNSNGQINNFGDFTYKSNTIDGIIENYKTLTLNGGSTFNVNSLSEIRNHCQVTFEKNTQFNGKLINNSKATFNNGFSINSNGRIHVASDSYTHVTSGSISIDGRVENLSTNVLTNKARIDLASSVTLGTMNANPAFKGGIDINTTLSGNNLKIANDVALNENTYIASSDCINVNLGSFDCTAASVNMNYSGIYQSPVVGNITLSATDVRVVGDKAYVSYHTNDEEFDDSPFGSIRVFDISNLQSPQLIAQADFNKAEFNSLEINGNTLYAVGNNKAGAIMYTVPLTDGMFTNNPDAIKSNNLPSLSAKNLNFNGTNIWLASSGTNGGLIKLNDDFSLNSNVQAVTGAKYVVSNPTKQVFLSLANGTPSLRFADNAGNLLYGAAKSFSSINLNVTDGKNTLALESDYVYAALSDAGVAKFDLSNGNLVDRFIPSELRGLDGYKVLKNNGRSNAVAVDADLSGCFLYVANGGDGVVVLNKKTMKYVGHFTLAQQRSANYVYSTNNHLFVASGRNGLVIINKN